MPETNKEDTVDTVVKLCKALGISVEKKKVYQLLTPHRLAAKRNFNPAVKSAEPPALIARFVNRDVRNLVFKRREHSILRNGVSHSWHEQAVCLQKSDEAT